RRVAGNEFHDNASAAGFGVGRRKRTEIRRKSDERSVLGRRAGRLEHLRDDVGAAAQWQGTGGRGERDGRAGLREQWHLVAAGGPNGRQAQRSQASAVSC